MDPVAEALAKVMERQLVLEAKLDAMIVHFGVAVGQMIEGVPCPACGKDIRFTPDFQTKTVVRTCGCGHGKFAPGVGLGEVIDLPRTGDQHGQGKHQVLRGRSEPDETE